MHTDKRVCCRCTQLLLLEAYPKDKTSTLGRSYCCRCCTKTIRLERYQRLYKDNSAYQERNNKLSKVWRVTHKDEVKAHNKSYRTIKRVEINEQHNQYEKDKRRTDPNFRVLAVLRTRLNQMVKRENKSASTLFLLGCPVEELRIYLSSKFVEGMSWDNYGQWHIDHIKPCAKFDLTKLEEQQKCFHYTNLQPL